MQSLDTIGSISTRISVKLDQERTRASLIDRAWSSGIHGRRRLESGFSHDVVKKLINLKKTYGEKVSRSEQLEAN